MWHPECLHVRPKENEHFLSFHKGFLSITVLSLNGKTMKRIDIRLLNICCFCPLALQTFALLCCCLVFLLCVFEKRRGEEPEWRKSRTGEITGSQKDVSGSLSQRVAMPHPWVQGSSAYWPREGSCQALRFTMVPSSPDLCGISRPKPIMLSVCPVLLYQAQEAFPPQ